MIPDGTVYIPSTSDDTYFFEQAYCYQCKHANPNPNGKKQCEIWARAVVGDINSHPPEWQYRNGEPRCTKWHEWDWEQKGDPDDPDNPNYIQPRDPNQIAIWPELDVFDKLMGRL